MGQMNIVCFYCGKPKPKGPGYDFVIGASLKPDWTMMEGTGKMTCPECYDKASRHAQHAINRATGL